MKEQMLWTNNYDKFEVLDFNRDVEKIKRLEKSMNAHGYIPAYPIHCYHSKNGKFKIKAGHHRFYVAKKLRLMIPYVVCADQATIFELESATNRWSLMDYLVAHIRQAKNKDYVIVKEYMDETGIGLSNAMSMLVGHSAGSGNYIPEFKNGTYKIKPESKHAETVKDIILHAKKCGVPFYNNTLFVQAVSKSVWVDEFSPSKFKAKVTTYAGIMEKKANLEQHLTQLEDVYNRQSREKIPLAFLATQKAKDRNALNYFKSG